MKKEDGNVQRLFEAANEGDFLKATISASNGKGPLIIHYNWLYSALNCGPGGATDFVWTFAKTKEGKLTLSPQTKKRLYASVRDDWEWYVQVQAPRSADWITAAGKDEFLEIEGTGLLSFVLKGFNGKYIAINQSETTHDNISGYKVQSENSIAVEDCEFQIGNPTVLQEGLKFLASYTPSAEDIEAIANAYGIPMDSAATSELLKKLPVLTPELLAQNANSVSNLKRGAGMWAGAIIGGIMFGAVGFALGGPGGAAAGVAVGSNLGLNIGTILELHSPSADPPPVVNPSNPSVANTLFSITPAGGPYQNKHYWHELIDFSKYPQIGDAKLPYAGCLYPPAANGSVQLWMPVGEKVAPFLIDDSKWPPIGINSGRYLYYMAIFVIVKTKTGKYQFRLHPDEALVNGPNRPNHPQMTQCGKICGMAGGEMEQVYAAGEMYCTPERQIRGITAKTGHFYDGSSSFDDNVTATAKAAVGALGYDTSKIYLGKAFWDNLNTD